MVKNKVLRVSPSNIWAAMNGININLVKDYYHNNEIESLKRSISHNKKVLFLMSSLYGVTHDIEIEALRSR